MSYTYPLTRKNHFTPSTPKKIYVIGTIVDAAIKRDLTKNKAEELNVRACKLPLTEFRKFNNFRKSLNITTVFEIINYGLICGDVMEAIDKALPNRYLKKIMILAR